METRDYSMFKFGIENRELDPFNLQKIRESIKTHGLIPGRPILINEDGYIVDGQHRFKVLQELNKPIEYEILTGETVSKTIALNSSQKQWNQIDYARCYAAQGHDDYRKLLKFEEKYKLGISNSIAVFSNHSIKAHTIKNGKPFKINENADKIGDFLENIGDLSFKKARAFVNAVITLFNKASDEQIQLIKNNALKIPHASNSVDYRTSFENIINYKKKANFFKL